MDLATLVGLVMCFVLVIFGIVFDGDSVIMTNINSFIDAPSAIITFGGAICCVLMMCSSFGDMAKKVGSFKIALKTEETNVLEAIENLIKLSNIAIVLST